MGSSHYYDAGVMWEAPMPRRVILSTERLSTTPTIASLAGRYRFDAQVCHLRWLQYRDGKIIPSRVDNDENADRACMRMKPPLSRSRPGSGASTRTNTETGSSSRPASCQTGSRATSAGTGSRVTSDGSSRPATATAGSVRAIRPGIDFSRRYYLLHLGYRQMGGTGEVDEINERVSRPTSASTGARDLEGKTYNYYTPQATKTYPLLPALETRFSGTGRVKEKNYDTMLSRLCKPTKASNWHKKSVPDPNDHPPEKIPIQMRLLDNTTYPGF